MNGKEMMKLIQKNKMGYPDSVKFDPFVNQRFYSNDDIIRLLQFESLENPSINKAIEIIEKFDKQWNYIKEKGYPKDNLDKQILITDGNELFQCVYFYRSDSRWDSCVYGFLNTDCFKVLAWKDLERKME